VYFNVYAVM